MPRLLPSVRAALVSLIPVLGAACASSGPPPAAPEGTLPQTVRVSTPGGQANVDLYQNVRSEMAEMPAKADVAYRALPAAFAAVGIEPNAQVPAERRVALVDGRFRRRLGRERVSRYVSCGTGMTGAPNADEYEVRLTVHARVTPAAGDTARSALATLVTATARPATSSNDPVNCSTTGALEVQLAQELRRLVAAR